MPERYTSFKAQPRPVAKNATPRPPPAGMSIGLEIQGCGSDSQPELYIFLTLEFTLKPLSVDN